MQQKFEQENCGGFEKIFPLNLEQISIEYQQVISNQVSTTEQKQMAQAVYSNKLNKHSVYNEILLTVNNTEHEKAVRQMIKQQTEQHRREIQQIQEQKIHKLIKKKKDKHDKEILEKEKTTI